MDMYKLGAVQSSEVKRVAGSIEPGGEALGVGGGDPATGADSEPTLASGVELGQ